MMLPFHLSVFISIVMVIGKLVQLKIGSFIPSL